MEPGGDTAVVYFTSPRHAEKCWAQSKSRTCVAGESQRNDPPVGNQDGDGGENENMEAVDTVAGHWCGAVDSLLVQGITRQTGGDASKGEAEGEAECEDSYCSHELHGSRRRNIHEPSTETEEDTKAKETIAQQAASGEQAALLQAIRSARRDVPRVRKLW